MQRKQYLVNLICGYGGIGRRKGLKIPRPLGRAGSTPATRTNNSYLTKFICTHCVMSKAQSPSK